MIKAINSIISRSNYPVFTPNQVLSNDDLNHLVNYLDEQNRLTRVYLIGMGIVCGLEVSSSYAAGKAVIHISAGCGITSEGYAIALSTTTLTHYQAGVSVAAALFAPSQQPESANSTASPKYTVIELFEQSSNQGIVFPQSHDKAFEDFLSDRVLVVVCELKDQQSDFCGLDYRNVSKERSLVYRFFLLPSTHNSNQDKDAIAAETLLRTGFEMDQLPSYWQGVKTEEVFTARNHYLQDFAPKVLRFGYTQSEQSVNSVDLTKISDYKTFWDNYYLVCQNAINAIGDTFPQIFRLFSPFFSSWQPNSVADFSTLKQRLESVLEGMKPAKERQPNVPPEKVEPSYILQYFYDYLSQLVAAYDELAEAAFDLMDDCAPHTQRFPKFLMLGVVPLPNQAPNGAATSAYRSHFSQPPIYNGNQQRVKQVRHLCDRLLKLCQEDSFSLLPFFDAPLKITPSKHSSVDLSEQAIPYYLDYAKLYQYWSYDAYRKGRSHLLPAYFSPKPDNNTVSITPREDLVNRLDSYNFYRIEGHIGKANSEALKRIREYQQRYNLAFDVITLKLGSQASLQDLNISGQFDDLEADFRRMQETFDKIWRKYGQEQKNALLYTMKKVFFDQPSLTVINSSQLYNPILELAKKPEAYEFAKDSTNQSYQLFVRDKNGTRIAYYVTPVSGTHSNELNNFQALKINFSGLTDDEITKEKQRIAEEMANCLSLGKITYTIVIDSTKYHLKLSSEYNVNLPPRDSKTGVVLLSLNHFAVDADQNQQSMIKQPEFQDFETLYSLLGDSPQKVVDNATYQMGNPQAAEELNYFEIVGLIGAYQRRIEQLMNLHLFNKFAEKHPGVEHLGGVPKGGTFILVYVDGEEIDEVLATDKDLNNYQLRTSRTAAMQKTVSFPPAAPQELIDSLEKLFQELEKRQDVVVGDFCLPYRCNNDAPAVNYVLARQRPIIRLEKTVFCEGDRHQYEFILEPPGGTVRGEGFVFANGKQLFQPSSISQASQADLAQGLEVAITFLYAVDDTYNTLTVTVYPLPKPNLSINNGQSFCHKAEPVEITLAPGTPENTELIQVNINGKETRTLDPSQFAQGTQPETVNITARVRSQQTQCENTITRTVTINPLPIAELSISEGQSFCHKAEPVEITLAPGTSENIELIQVNINGEDTKTLDPSQFAPGTQPETVTIIGKIRNQQTECENTITRTVTINPLPLAELSITEGQSFCHDAEPVEITLAPGTSENIELIQVNINGEDTKTLDPSQFAPGTQPETVTIIASIRNQKTQCENTITRTVTINPVPVADFQAEIANINPQGFSVRVFNIQPAQEPSFSFVWEYPGGESNTNNPGNNEFIINYNYDFNTWVADAKVSITLRVTTPSNLSNCSSEPVTKDIAIPSSSVVGFNLLIKDSDSKISSFALESNRTFRISELPVENEYAIQAVTVPTNADSVVFTYTAPGDDPVVSRPINTAYRLPNGWQNIVGIHRIQAQAFRVVNGERLAGVAAAVIIRIIDDTSDTSVPTPSTPKSATVLDRLRVLLEMSNERIAGVKAFSRYEDPTTSLVNYQYKFKANHVLAVTVATLLFIVGWSYTSTKQPEYQQNYHQPQR